MPEAGARGVLLKDVLRNFTTCARVSSLIKLQAETWNFIKKENLADVFL